MKITDSKVHDIFQHIGRLCRNKLMPCTVYCYGRYIYTLNEDYTVLLRFRLYNRIFPVPLSFAANDYDGSDQIEVKDGKICFIQEEGIWRQEKSCRTPDQTFSDVHQMYKSLSAKIEKKNRTIIGAWFIKCLNKDLSHIEFNTRNGKLFAIQRNIYNGGVKVIDRIGKPEGPPDINWIVEDFAEKVGIRVPDFLALFRFTPQLEIYWGEQKWPGVWVRSHYWQRPFTGIVSLCVYDEIGIVKEKENV